MANAPADETAERPAAAIVSPLPSMRLRGCTTDSESFRTIDLATEVELPLLPHCGAFAVVRSKHTHEGVDLYAPHGAPVAAVEAGRVVRIVDLTGPKAQSPWWLDTQAVMVASSSWVVCYGEVRARDDLRVGSDVDAGEVIGSGATVLAKDKGRPRAMLHFEMYRAGYEGMPVSWEPPELQRPEPLLDPTAQLLPLFASKGARAAGATPPAPATELAHGRTAHSLDGDAHPARAATDSSRAGVRGGSE
ncbi:hypothetical protein KFE25_007876 [Diacronema lutheri]|uniref:M23ase beta-sheet core domain-containing protein n=1 Tax=Diacronema lutheri TaxID=2081491 RepID=A0A8J6CIY8_DIALT|nr:hypothetical protein KFE25_007876 [Diacronema lutheri]